jgi:hypothetical protein
MLNDAHATASNVVTFYRVRYDNHFRAAELTVSRFMTRENAGPDRATHLLSPRTSQCDGERYQRDLRALADRGSRVLSSSRGLASHDCFAPPIGVAPASASSPYVQVACERAVVAGD